MMRSRCLNPSDISFPRYGGRGITFDKRWAVFENFLADMGERPRGTTLDRKNNDKGYTKENCRWVTMKEQQRNRRNNRTIRLNGKDVLLLSVSEWTAIPYQRLYERIIRRGWSISQAIAINAYQRQIGAKK